MKSIYTDVKSQERIHDKPSNQQAAHGKKRSSNDFQNFLIQMPHLFD